MVVDLPPFFSPSFSCLPLLVTPKVSSLHKKQETPWLCYHYSYKNKTTTGSYPAFFFFIILWHQERQGGGGSSGGFGGTQNCHRLCLIGPEIALELILEPFVLCVFVFEWGCQQQWTPALSRSGKRRGGVCSEAVRRLGTTRDGGSNPSSVVVLRKVQGAQGSQVAKAQPQALHVEAVDLPLLALQQVFDPVGSLLLKGNQLLFNLQETGEQQTSRVDILE